MRLAGQIKGGYYPAPPEAIDAVMDHVSPPAGGKKFSILDPCCGQGFALNQIAERLKCTPEKVFGCELSGDLGEDARKLMPDSRIVPCADFLTLQCSKNVFEFVWCNPPFDTVIGGGRIELKFLQAVTDNLATNGVLALIIPESVGQDYEIQRLLMSWYHDISVMPFPKKFRKYNEVAFLAVKNKEAAPWYGSEWEKVCSLNPGQYSIPASANSVVSFRKVTMSDQETISLLGKSPANRLLEPRLNRSIKRPPLPLGSGHIALLIASGQLDGLVEPPNEPPHVVRGTAKKVEFVDGVTESEDLEADTMSTVTIIKQRIVIVVRAVDGEGKIKTFTDKREGEVDAGVLVEEIKERNEPNGK